MSQNDNEFRVRIRTGTSERAPVYRANDTSIAFPLIFHFSIYNDDMERVLRESMENDGINRNDSIELDIDGTTVLSEYDLEREEYKAECCICQKKYETGDSVSEIQCKHVFHTECIKEWGKYKQECPQCRERINFFIS